MPGNEHSSAGVCRVCLASDVRMLPIGEALQPVYEKLAGTTLHADLKPTVACYICHALLLKSRRLMLRAVTAEKALKAVLNVCSVVTKSSVSAVDRRAAGLCASLAVSRLECLDNIRWTPGLQVKTEHVRSNHFNGELEDSEEKEEEEEPAPAAAASDVESEPDEASGRVSESDSSAELPEEDVAQNSERSQQARPRKHRCEVCARTFKRRCHLVLHGRAHAQRALGCARCGRRFALRASLNRHLRLCRRAPIEHECNICLRKFEHKHNLTRHVKNIHSSEKVYTCDVCGRNYVTEHLLQIHVKSHTEIVKCDFCPRQFARRKFLERHMEIRHDSAFRCSVCDKRFSVKRALMNHLKSHKGEHECEQGFLMKKDLDQHLVIHAKHKPYKCQICPRQFLRKVYYDNHLRKHGKTQNGDSNQTQLILKQNRVYQCQICPYRSNISSNFKAHMRTHSGEKPFQCEICYRGLVTKQTLQHHVRNVHGNDLHRCAACHRRFPSKVALDSHMETHETEEEEQETLDAAAPGDKPYRCSLCPMQFSLKIAYRKHVIAEHL